ncbi:tRNA 2-thiouridine(34) synthase MnmA [Paludibacter sp. 221]|uniref:tRNA 2-thiouridine(34) synthase MnmA n=1 Tax=Paludibacter sp. 221 TaxID=2302939 RepID=UPI0013D607E3|nr:tRNA 2-thiouridine(34) synthase MnmA [Paludibacter sp. 221]NDV46349.1 tRNA 2-thiouridine(34) synthase MnmA [Paludibacter sp. 221]
MNIAALLSGGVDSSVVVHLLKEAGYTPDLFYIKIGSNDDDELHCTSEEDIEMASLVAHKYGCKLEIIDLHRDYWDNVVAYTIDKVKKGLTPNPDVMCNKLIKFGVFENRVGKNYDKTATGHYATTIEKDGKTYLGTAKDPLKDQTDFLAQLDVLQVSKLMFPVGSLMKNEVREIALNANLPSAKRHDSQGICFLGKVNYNDFIARYLGEKEGPIVELETGKVLGTHKGYWFHTVGQRKGLSLSGGPWYVIKKDVDANVVFVSKGYGVESQYGYEFAMHDFHFITDTPWGENGKTDITFKIRHTPEFTKGKICKTPKGYQVISNEKLQGIAPGQFGVIYDNDSKICIGSGEISY